jgi:two-component system response regulator AtoC
MKPQLHHRPDLHPEHFHGITTVAPQMLQLFDRIRRAARAESTVLVRGETGTGKELVARAVHACSRRASRPFRAVNCATFTPELLASELFGHVRGAFTGAVQNKSGLFEQADHGTLFLDEIAELPLELQARLLRVLQEQRFVPVGGTQEVSVDVRLVSATNAALRDLVADHRFREDLMYRVRVVVLYIPPLRERTGDLQALLWHFIDEFNETGLRRVDAVDHEAWEAICAYRWPGNVRELRNNVEQAFVFGEGPVLRLDELSLELQSSEPEPTAPTTAPPSPGAPELTLDQIRRAQLIDAIQRTGGRREEMAELLGLSRSTLYRRLKAFGLT